MKSRRRSALPQYADFSRTKFFTSLDGLRALSILGVIWSHVWYTSGLRYFNKLETIPVLRMGGFGVDVFFCISGFLITTLLLRERSRNGKISLRDFYIRRSLRIWPLYYVTLAVYVVLVLALQRGTGRDRIFFHYFPYYLTYTYTWAQGWAASGAIFNFAWSLSVEEQFYVVWAVVLRVLKGAVPVFIMLAMILLRLSTNWTATTRVISQDSLPWRIAAAIAIPICLGSILAHALHSEVWFRRMRMLLGFRWSAPLFLLALTVSLAFSGIRWSVVQWFVLPFLIGSSVIREDNGLSPFLRFRPLAYMGVISYGMYMLNTLALDCLVPVMKRVHLFNPVLRFPIAVAATVLAAAISYRFLETPFLRIKDRFSRIHSAKSAPKTSTSTLLPESHP
jgi:peptidoglycan/LPS O-acetylase OafA/YrhL